MGEGGTVAVGVAEVLFCLGIVALGEVEVTEDLCEAVSAGGTGDELFGTADVTLLEGEEPEVSLGFGELAGGVEAVEQGIVALGIADGGDVVEGALPSACRRHSP